MKQDKKCSIKLEDGNTVEASFPVILSASRRTDIPAFYAQWFFHRLQQGYSAWTNPYNGVKTYVGYADVKFIVFWSKNPKPLLPYLNHLKERNLGCYIHYTLNDYEQLEPGLPPLQERIETFKIMAKNLPRGAVIWRFDPLLLTDRICEDLLLAKIENIGRQLAPCSEKLIVSFADISYRKVRLNLNHNKINYIEWLPAQKNKFLKKLLNLSNKLGLTLSLCSDDSAYSFVEPSKCIDDALIARLGSQSRELCEFLGAIPHSRQAGLFTTASSSQIVITRNNKDRNQRPNCLCARSKDIGDYNTCPHGCLYCYANSSPKVGMANWLRAKMAPFRDSIK